MLPKKCSLDSPEVSKFRFVLAYLGRQDKGFPPSPTQTRLGLPVGNSSGAAFLTDVIINVVTLSRPFAPSLLACSIPLSLIPPSHIMMKEGKHFLPELPLSPCHGRVGPFVPSAMTELCHPHTHPPEEMLPAIAVASFPKLLPLSIMHSICHPVLPPLPHYSVAGRHISRRHLPHPPLSDPPLSLMFGLGLLWRFSSLRHHASE